MIDRRAILAIGAASGAVALLPLSAMAQSAEPAADAAAAPAKTPEELIAEFTGGAEVSEGGVKLDTPEIAENGNTVPVTVDAPGASEVLLVAVENPTPAVATIRFGDLAGSQKASTRIRLAQTSDVIAVAKLEDGSYGQDRKNVKVTIGGCGG